MHILLTPYIEFVKRQNHSIHITLESGFWRQIQISLLSTHEKRTLPSKQSSFKTGLEKLQRNLLCQATTNPLFSRFFRTNSLLKPTSLFDGLHQHHVHYH